MKRLLILTAIVALFTAFPAQSQVRLGVKAGVTVNSLHLNQDIFDSENQTGFTGGLVLDCKVPLVGLGFDISAMYVRRNAKFMEAQEIAKCQRDYIEIPLNIKYNISIPAIDNLITPYLATGPSVSFLTSRRHEDGFNNKSCAWSWNFGLGLLFLNKVQIGASYGLGMNKVMDYIYDNTENIKGRNRYWTVTAAYFF